MLSHTATSLRFFLFLFATPSLSHATFSGFASLKEATEKCQAIQSLLVQAKFEDQPTVNIDPAMIQICKNLNHQSQETQPDPSSNQAIPQSASEFAALNESCQKKHSLALQICQSPLRITLDERIESAKNTTGLTNSAEQWRSLHREISATAATAARECLQTANACAETCKPIASSPDGLNLLSHCSQMISNINRLHKITQESIQSEKEAEKIQTVGLADGWDPKTASGATTTLPGERPPVLEKVAFNPSSAGGGGDPNTTLGRVSQNSKTPPKNESQSNRVPTAGQGGPTRPSPIRQKVDEQLKASSGTPNPAPSNPKEKNKRGGRRGIKPQSELAISIMAPDMPTAKEQTKIDASQRPYPQVQHTNSPMKSNESLDVRNQLQREGQLNLSPERIEARREGATLGAVSKSQAGSNTRQVLPQRRSFSAASGAQSSTGRWEPTKMGDSSDLLAEQPRNKPVAPMYKMITIGNSDGSQGAASSENYVPPPTKKLVLADYLPNGSQYRQGYAPAGMDPDRSQIQPRAMNIWQLISERFKSRCLQNRLKDCRQHLPTK